MATNPMQRKARNSFLLGMLIMLLITGIIIGLLGFQLVKIKQAEQQEKASLVTVYVLNKDLDSGEEFTQADLETTQVTRSNAPTDYLTPNDLGNKNMAKIKLTSGTVLSKEMVYTEDDNVGDDVRKQEYNMILLPADLETGDYVDVRLTLPSGIDYIVVSKKKVEIPNIAGVDSTDTVWMNLSEEEILAMSNAIYEAYQLIGSKLYINKYSEPGIQEAATPTYPVKREILQLIQGNPNLVEEARNALYTRYNDSQAEQRNNVINRELENAGEQGQTNVQTKVEESITNSKSTRKQYLDSLSGTSTTTTTTTTE